MTAATTRAAAALAAAGLAWGATTTAHAETFRWINPAGGAWTDRQNWNPVGSPSPEDVVIFDLPEAFAIETPIAEVRRAIFRSGQVRLMRRTPDSGVLVAMVNDPVYPPGLLIGDRPDEAASLAAELPINVSLSMVGFEGVGSLETNHHLLTDELIAGARPGAVGDIVVAGADSHLEGTGFSPRMPVDRVTLGVSGQGKLSLLDGAVGRVSKLLLASESDGRGELTLAGDGTSLDADTITFGPGRSIIRVEAGATLRLPPGEPLIVNTGEGQHVELTLDGGALDGPTTVVMDENHIQGSVTLSLRSGSSLFFNEEVQMQHISMSGENTRLAAPSLHAGGGLQLRDGALLELGIPDTASLGHHAMVIGGEVLIDQSNLLVDDGVDVSGRRHMHMFLGGTPARAGSVVIRNRSVLEAEGRLELNANTQSFIEGESRVIQRVQSARSGLFINSDPVDRGLLSVNSYTLRGGSQVHGSFVALFGRIVVEGQSTTISADERLQHQQGDLHVRGGARVEAPVIVVQRQHSQRAVLLGDGLLVGAVSNEGAVDPGEAGAPGALRVEGDYNQRPHTIPPVETAFEHVDGPDDQEILAGELRIDIAGRDPGEHDRLVVSGAATLGGTLRATLAEGFQPVWGDRFVFLTAGVIDAGFETLEAPPAPPGLVWEVEFTDAAAALALHRKSDLTRDLAVDAQDLGVLLAQWGLPDSPADLNGDGFVDGADLGRLLAQWGLRAN